MSDIYITQKSSAHKIQSSYQKYFFLFFAVLGFVFIWVTKLLGVPQLLVTSSVVAMVCIYCFTTYKSTSFGLREDQIGDNAYYLGFLYTLSSLSYALWKFSSQNIGTEIVSSFGVALWSTICGVALRVFFSQMYQDPNEIEEGARARVAETADRLTIELNHASLAFNTYSRNLRQSIEEAFDGMNKAIKQNLEMGIENYSTAKEEMTKQFQGTFDEFKSNVKKLNNASEKVANSVEDLYQRINNIETPKDILVSKIDGIFKEAEQSGSKLNERSQDHIKSSESVIQSTNFLMQNIESLNSHISLIKKSSEAISESLQGFESFSQKINSVGNSVTNFSGNLSTSFDELLSKHKNVAESISNHANEMEKQLVRSRQYTEQTHESMSSMVKTLSSQLQ